MHSELALKLKWGWRLEACRSLAELLCDTLLSNLYLLSVFQKEIAKNDLQLI